MHDPDVVAFVVPRPWPQRTAFSATGSAGDGVRWRARLHHDCGPWCADGPPHKAGAFPWWKPRSYSRFWRMAGRDFYWPPLVTVWHREPGGRDALAVCQDRVHRRFGKRAGEWKLTRTWHWHVTHWRVQCDPALHARRWLLTRCQWCGGKSRKGDLVNFSNSWHPPRRPWWAGEEGLFHEDCHNAHRCASLCLCPVPGPLEHRDYGKCGNCGRFRPFNYQPNDADRWLAALDPGERPSAELRARVAAFWRAERADA